MIRWAATWSCKIIFNLFLSILKHWCQRLLYSVFLIKKLSKCLLIVMFGNFENSLLLGRNLFNFLHLTLGEFKEPVIIACILERRCWLFKDIPCNLLILQAKINQEIEHCDTLLFLKVLSLIHIEMTKESLLNYLRASARESNVLILNESDHFDTKEMLLLMVMMILVKTESHIWHAKHPFYSRLLQVIVDLQIFPHFG